MISGKIKSSYAENNLGETLRSVVRRYKPRRIVEFGVFQAYSTIHMATELAELAKIHHNHKGHIVACDLWDKYPFNHTAMEVAQKNINEHWLDNYVTLWQADFFEWLKQPSKFDILHVDISNDGNVVEQTLIALENQIKDGAVVIFEGGSVERDNIDWMIKYNKRPINPLIGKLNLRILDERFPSLSIAAVH